MLDIQKTIKQAPEQDQEYGRNSIRECLEIFPQRGEPKEGPRGQMNHIFVDLVKSRSMILLKLLSGSLFVDAVRPGLDFVCSGFEFVRRNRGRSE